MVNYVFNSFQEYFPRSTCDLRRPRVLKPTASSHILKGKLAAVARNPSSRIIGIGVINSCALATGGRFRQLQWSPRFSPLLPFILIENSHALAVLITIVIIAVMVFK